MKVYCILKEDAGSVDMLGVSSSEDRARSLVDEDISKTLSSTGITNGLSYRIFISTVDSDDLTSEIEIVPFPLGKRAEMHVIRGGVLTDQYLEKVEPSEA